MNYGPRATTVYRRTARSS
ncbi:Protein of unknown function [Lactobacillus delbrueckii subsp. lactis]|nr:Protein of unknown function [Lactobacillus delbrueckii subsp. lactis]